jgi:hypothetical protein
MRRYPAANGVRLKGLSQSGRWPSGNPRFYLRKPGQKAIAMPDLPKNSPAFVAAWLDAMAGKLPIGGKPPAQSVGALVVAFCASAAYQNLAPTTRAYMRRNLDAIRKTWGEATAASLQTRHILADLAKLEPHPANNRLRAWKALCRWGFQEAAMLATDPAKPIAKRRAKKSSGHKPWTREEVAQFRAFWPHGTSQRLAFELMHRTGAAIADACKIGPRNSQRSAPLFSRGRSGADCIGNRFFQLFRRSWKAG